MAFFPSIRASFSLGTQLQEDEEEAINHVSPGPLDADYNAKNHFVQSMLENVLQAYYCRMAHLFFQVTYWVCLVWFVFFLFIDVDTQGND